MGILSILATAIAALLIAKRRQNNNKSWADREMAFKSSPANERNPENEIFSAINTLDGDTSSTEHLAKSQFGAKGYKSVAPISPDYGLEPTTEISNFYAVG